ncbi:C-C chemokine receptor type 2-like [Archocentrus centrarchus]|uniref:C-C chemokine receptor type 2-like n=1 Tax=Archocentrus centrarchus TaxID=63155 RepID=UPI0011EA3ECB|nr:C-C chemokine receptor type 2-like [Archocentrus centrarchus]XP_030605777.1 C-C chemokine receptor type 2-like [Archocentrus centrarchus]XP_030605778.1 C-C chemokine receptor type 2-like [Archocentrus centrarchus]
MSDENSTSYDYSGYYDDPSDYSPSNFSDVKNFSQVFLPTLYSLVFILGFIGNALVVYVVLKHRNQSNLTDICLFNLALSDLLFVFTLPFYSHYASAGQWTFGGFMCRLISGSHQTGFFSSIFFMIVMTLDRYMIIVHAHRVARYRTMRAAITLTVFIWMLSLFVSLPDFIFTEETKESQRLGCDYPQENKVWERYDLFTTNVLGLVIPLLVMVGCYSRIIPTLVTMRTTKKHRIVKLIICIVVAFFLLWAPYNISRFLKFLQEKTIIQQDLTLDKNLRLSVAVTEAIAYTHCCLNPIIYAFVGQKFMRRALQLLKRLVPGYIRNLSNSSFRRSSVISKSSEVTSTYVM